MAIFVIRRLAVSFLTLLAATFVVFVLVANSGDPLEEFRADPNPATREAKMQGRIDLLGLDQSVPERYVSWLGGAAGCVVGDCDLGKNIKSQDVTNLISQALSATLRLVVVATIAGLVVGVSLGVISALRQYSGFDYTLTFSAFLFYSLPVFAFAVLLKQYWAIQMNDWLREPKVGIPTGIVLAIASGVFWGAVIGGDRRRKWLVRAGAGVATFGILMYLSAVEWFSRPQLGPVLITLIVFGIAFGVTELIAGIRRRPRVLYASLIMAFIAAAGQFFFIPFLQDRTWATWTNLLLLGLLTVLVGIGVGFAVGGLDKGQAARVAVATGLFSGAVLVVEILLLALPTYSRSQRGRIFATVGSNTPNFDGDFWQRFLDIGSHLILPTVAIMLASVAQYTRYSRASMLEVMNQDYVRTARAKGLTERTVIMRHAFRNAMIPLATLAAIDFGFVLSGAIITEWVFGWRGMGQLFIQGLRTVDPNSVMGFFIVTAVAIVVFNLLADIAYAYLDPRIRIS